MPKLVGLTLAQAKRRVEKAHCKLGKVVRRRAKRRHGRVLAQAPKAGKQVGGRTKVKIVVSKRMRPKAEHGTHRGRQAV